MAGTCNCGNEPSGCINCGEFLAKLKTELVLKEDSAAYSKKGVGILWWGDIFRTPPPLQTDPGAHPASIKIRDFSRE